MANHYRSEIDGLRAVSVIGVVLFHLGLGFPGGFVGVDVFFVISGYLITGILLRQLGEDRLLQPGCEASGCRLGRRELGLPDDRVQGRAHHLGVLFLGGEETLQRAARHRGWVRETMMGRVHKALRRQPVFA